MHIRSLPTLTQLSDQTKRLIFAAGSILLLVNAIAIGMRMHTLATIPSDFTQDYMAVLALQKGQSIYEPFTADELAAQGIQERPGIVPRANYHPPFNILLFAPLAQLPYSLAIGIWTWGSILLYLLIGSIILRELAIAIPQYWKLFVIGASLLWYPFQFHIILAQLSLILVACIIGCWVLLRRQRDVIAGVLLGLAILIKLFPALLLLHLVIHRRWRAIGATLLTITLGMLLTLLVVGSDDVVRYHTEVVPLNVATFQTAILNVSMTAVFHRLFVGDMWISPLIYAPQVAKFLAIASNIALGLLLVHSIWLLRSTSKGETIAYALVCAAMPVLTPTSWSHSFALLILPFGLLLRELLSDFDPRLFKLGLLAFVLVSLPDVTIARTIAALYQPERVPWHVTLIMVLPTAGVLFTWYLVRTRVLPDDQQLS